MPAFKVSSSIDINVDITFARDAIGDFNTWPIWSPWLTMEPDCALTYQGTPNTIGHGYQWVGKKVGAGGMVLTAHNVNRLECDLNFLKPWKSQADIAFEFESVGDEQTRVTWHMDSQLPFYMFFMLGKMKAMIESDYVRGLRMLKDYLEHGAVTSNVQTDK